METDETIVLIVALVGLVIGALALLQAAGYIDLNPQT